MAKKKQSTALVRSRKRQAVLDRARARMAEQHPQDAGVMPVFERLARNPKLTVDKLGELIKLQERIVEREAKTAFETAYALMLPEIPHITKRGVVKNKQGQVQSRYARYEDIRRIVDPIMRRFGFTYHSTTDWPAPGVLVVIGMLTHAAGHTRTAKFQTEADASGGKNAIQGLGSGISYGQRYTLRQLLSIVDLAEDDDGQAHGAALKEKHEREAHTPPPAKTSSGAPAAPVHHAQAAEPITSPQRRRMFAIASRMGRKEEDIRTWLEKRYGLTSTRDIPRNRYEEICEAIEAPGPLSMERREPGQEG